MPSPLHLLILEDRAVDAELMLYELRRAGLAVDGQRVETEADYVAALDPALDLILADYSLPQFNAQRALQLLQQHGFDVPFIIVTGSISEEIAVECMKQGAADYLLKDRMTRLGQAVTHALEQKRLRVENQQAAEALRESEARFRVIFEQANDAIHVSNSADEILEVNPRMCELMGYSRAELLKMHVADLQAPEVRESSGSVITNELARHGGATFESLNLHHSGRPIPVEISVARIESAQGDLYVSIVRDIAERRRAESQREVALEALRQSEELLRVVLTNILDPVFITDDDGQFTFVCPNVLNILGYSLEDIQTQGNISNLVEDGLISCEELAARGEITNRECVIVDHAGRPRVFLTMVKRVSIGRGTILYTFHDITERKQAEKSLRESEQQLRLIADNIPAIVNYVNAQDLRYRFVNRVYADMYGMLPEQIQGKQVKEILDEAAYARALPYIDRARSGEQVSYENIVLDRGEPHWFNINYIPEFDAQGTVQSVIVLAVDITERKRAEEALYDQQQVFRTLVENSPDIIARYDRGCQRVYANPTYLKVAQIPQQELLATSPIQRSPLPAASAAVLQNLLRKVLDSGVAEAVDVIWPKADNIDYWYNIYASPEFDREGRVVSVMTISRDITERKQAEEALKESEHVKSELLEKLNEAQQMAMIGSWEWNLQTNHVWWSAETYRIFGVTPQDFVPSFEANGKFMHPDDFAKYGQSFEHSLRTGEPLDVNLRLVANDGRLKHCQAKGKIIFDDSGQPLRFIGTIMDITERKQAEEAIRLANLYNRSLIEASLDPLVTIGRDGKIADVNTSTEQVTGCKREELIGSDFSDYFTAPEKAQAGYRQVFLTGSVRDYPLEIRHRAGHITSVLYNATVYNDDQGNVAGVFAAARDVTERNRAEEALRESARRERERAAELQTIMDTVPAAIWIAHDQMSHVITGNRAAYELVRLPPGSNASRTAPENQPFTHTKIYQNGIELPPNDLPLQLSAATGVEIRDFEEDIVFDDGTVVHELGNIMPLFDEAGRPRGAVGAFIDITERKQVEADLAQERLLLRTVIDNLPDAVYAKDRQGRKILTNRADLDIIGKPEVEVLGKTDADLFPWHVATQFEADDQSVLHSGQSILNREELLINEQGRQIWQRTSKLPLKDAAGQIVGLVGIGHNITDRKQAEKQLRQLSRAVEQSPVTVVITDTVGNIEYANPRFEQTTGYAVQEAIGQNPRILKSDHTPAQEYTQLWRTILSGGEWRGEFHNKKKNGDLYWESATISPILNERGEITHFLAVKQDITERKQAEQEHLTHLRFFENMDKVNRAIQGTPDLEQMMSDVLETVLSIFDCDRSWLLYPCDPDVLSFRVPVEVTKPEYPGAKILNVDVPMSPGEAQNMREALESDGPVTYTAGTDRPISTAAQFGVQSQMFVPVYPKLGKPWVFGMHQCSYPRVWTQEEKKLFQEIGRRLTDGLTSLLAYRDLRESEAILKEAQRVGQLGSWDWDAQTDTITWSEEYYHIYGFDPQQRPPGYVEHLKAYTPESAARLDVAVKLNLQTGEPYELDLELARPDGPSRWITSRSETRRDKNGRIVGLRGTAHDITERKLLEEHLREQVATLQAVAEIDREIIVVTEPEGVLELVCRRAADLVHVPKSVIGTLSLPNDEMTVAASHGLRDPKRLSEEFARAWQSGSLRAEILRTPETIGLNDTLVADRVRFEVGLSEDVRAVALAPLIAGEKVLGVLGVFDITPHVWLTNELQLLSLLAGQAAIALEKLRLFQADRARAAQLAMLNEIAQAITSSLDLDLVLVTLLEKVRQASTAEACSVALVDKESGDLVFRQAVGGATHEVIGLRLPPGEGVAGWVAQHQQSVRVDDAASDARVHALQTTAGPDGTRFVTHNLVCVPLIVRDTVTGVLELVNSQRGKFGQGDVQLLESVAAQAAIIIENVRLFEAEHAGRERLETLYRIGQAINSTLEADTILDRLTDEAVRATQATHGSALVANPDRRCFERRSLRGYTAEEAARARTDALPLERGVNGRAYRLRQPVSIDDVTVDPDYHPLISTTRSELAVPIMRGGQVIGNLDLQSPHVKAFHSVDLPFLQALTDQVAIALENARLFAETQRQMDELTVVSQVALVGAAGRPFDETVARATDALSRLWPEASLGFLFVDESGQVLRMHASYLNSTPTENALDSITLEQGLMGWAARERRALRVGDVTKDEHYVARSVNTRSKMVAPLMVGQQVIGVVNVETPSPDAFSGDDLRLLTTLAGQLAVIFEKARLDAALIEHAVLLEQRVQERTAEIHRQQARTQAILDALGEGVVVTDPQGVIQYLNPAMEQTTGFSVTEALGQEARLWQSDQTPEEVYQEMWATVRIGRTWAGEVVNRRKDGELYSASLTTAPILTSEGGTAELVGAVSIQRDITERKRAEAALRESEALYHSLVEVMPQNLCRKDLAGHFTFANHQFLADLKWSLTDLVGKTDFDIHPPTLAEKYRRDDQQVISTGQILEVIEERTVSGGKLLYVQTIKAPILNSAGNVIGVQITFWDVSDRIQAEEEMRRALEKERELNALKSQFVSLTSHEFRTPLTTILSSAEMLEHYWARWSAERRQEHLRRIQTAVKYMTGLLNDVLVVGKAEAGRLEFVPKPLDLLKFCRDLVEEFELMDQGQHLLQFESSGECLQARLDDQLLRHIFTNLLSNALKYSPAGSVVEFAVTCQSDQAVFRIQDHGLGIPLEDQARLFETFHRASNARNIAGTGLGLTIVKRSVDLHGGTIEVVSQVGVGTTVTVTLPLGALSDT